MGAETGLRRAMHHLHATLGRTLGRGRRPARIELEVVCACRKTFNRTASGLE